MKLHNSRSSNSKVIVNIKVCCMHVCTHTDKKHYAPRVFDKGVYYFIGKKENYIVSKIYFDCSRF